MKAFENKMMAMTAVNIVQKLRNKGIDEACLFGVKPHAIEDCFKRFQFVDKCKQLGHLECIVIRLGDSCGGFIAVTNDCNVITAATISMPIDGFYAIANYFDSDSNVDEYAKKYKIPASLGRLYYDELFFVMKDYQFNRFLDSIE